MMRLSVSEGYLILWIVYGIKELKKRRIEMIALLGATILLVSCLLNILFLVTGTAAKDTLLCWILLVADIVIVLIWRILVQRKIKEEKDMRS